MWRLVPSPSVARVHERAHTHTHTHTHTQTPRSSITTITLAMLLTGLNAIDHWCVRVHPSITNICTHHPTASRAQAMQTNGTWCARQRAAGKICWPNCHSRLPAPFDRFVSQLALEGSLIQRRGGKLISWEWESYLSPFSDVCDGAHAASAADNYRRYVHYLRGG